MTEHIRKVYAPMTETAFYILLCLQKPGHGYGVVQQVEKLTGGAVRLAPGTMYGSLSKMERTASSPLSGRRKSGKSTRLPIWAGKCWKWNAGASGGCTATAWGRLYHEGKDRIPHLYHLRA